MVTVESIDQDARRIYEILGELLKWWAKFEESIGRTERGTVKRVLDGATTFPADHHEQLKGVLNLLKDFSVAVSRVAPYYIQANPAVDRLTRCYLKHPQIPFSVAEISKLM